MADEKKPGHGVLTFKIPANSPLRVDGKFSVDGKEVEEIEVPYNWKPIDSDDNALSYFKAKQEEATTEKGKERWSLKSIANKLAEKLAYQATYQRLLKEHTPIEQRENPEDAFADAIRNLMEAGLSQEAAQAAIAGARAAKSAQ